MSTFTSTHASPVPSPVALSVPIAAISGSRPPRHTTDAAGARETGGVAVGLGAAFVLRQTLAFHRRTHLVFGDAAAETGVVAAASEDVGCEVTVGRQRTRPVHTLTRRRRCNHSPTERGRCRKDKTHSGSGRAWLNEESECTHDGKTKKRASERTNEKRTTLFTFWKFSNFLITNMVMDVINAS